jgi:hypothetical protein
MFKLALFVIAGLAFIYFVEGPAYEAAYSPSNPSPSEMSKRLMKAEATCQRIFGDKTSREKAYNSCQSGCLKLSTADFGRCMDGCGKTADQYGDCVGRETMAGIPTSK